MLLIHVFLILVFSTAIHAQESALLVRWEREAAPGSRKAVGLPQERRWLARELGIELLRYPDPASCARARKMLADHPDVRAVELDARVDFRRDPNDALYDEQNNLLRVGYDRAWELTTGGTTSEGADIVVAVLDAGFDLTHPDLRDNLWRNPGEIPDDGIDNDGNGYVDDLHGWDMAGGDASLPNNRHGTEVIGVLGARGDNEQGVTGTNWRTKMMLFSINTSADIVEAYEYVRYQRQLWHDSGGRAGALVVATNASFGVLGETCANFTVWGAMYDAMGRTGILTAASTANKGWNVDDNGDMPTDCPSEYLLSVANVGTNDQLFGSSGFGRKNVDLGAPGEGSHTTRPGGAYGPFGSTSAAAPYVTGAIALLYATPCPELLQAVRDQPASAALLVRDAIINSTRDNASLRNVTTTGGMLDVPEAQRILLENCGGGVPDRLEITRVSPNPATDAVLLETNAVVLAAGAEVTLYDALGRRARVQRAVREPGTPVRLRLNLAGLPAGWYQAVIMDRDRAAYASLIIR